MDGWGTKPPRAPLWLGLVEFGVGFALGALTMWLRMR